MSPEPAAASGAADADAERLQALKEFKPSGRGLWADVPDSDWHDWKWQLKHRISSVEQLEQLLPTLTSEEIGRAHV